MNFSPKDAALEIKQIYKRLNFYDLYGTSLVLCIALTLVVVGVHSYFKALINLQSIQKNWPEERCKPQNIMIAGFINRPKGQSILQYTQDNFAYCVQNVLKNIVGDAVNPFVFLTDGLHELYLTIGVAINEIRYVFSYIRDQITRIAQEILGRVLNIMIPFQQMIMGVKDMMMKTQAILVSSLYTFVGVYYALVSGLGSIVEFILLIIAMLLAIAIPLIAVPFTMEIGLAVLAAATAISVPFAMISAVLCETFGMCPTTNSPRLCFDKDTMIELANGETKPIASVQVGEKTKESGIITAKFALDATHVDMYELDGIRVSGIHRVKWGQEWIFVKNHPRSIPLPDYSEKVIYCLNTESKRIHWQHLKFLDWDELYQEKEINVLLNEIEHQDPQVEFLDCSMVHKYLDGGFERTTFIPLANGTKREIHTIQLGDVLEDGSQVIGLVELDGTMLVNQFEYILGNVKTRDWTYVRGGPNLIVDDLSTLSSYKKVTKAKTLYHLLTDTHHFPINDLQFLDYNGCLDHFLVKKEVKDNKTNNMGWKKII